MAKNTGHFHILYLRIYEGYIHFTTQLNAPLLGSGIMDFFPLNILIIKNKKNDTDIHELAYDY